ncbi:hypothetical protein [Actinopolyspora mortivallis]|uniref:Histidine kinase/HSP90-like ATPase domain-containing protein n=1 Tax=Actinopolyspora mortivallis TaxID=33906 RepID=A0A2T0GY16_ACTMO|nr:hypothetical protein [Actinopolyspora mortivallis]PRW63987.1 hypothetical protein CEP50_07280 [Actinopolyspora mortivallis]
MDTEIAQTDDLRLVALQSAVNCTDMFVRFTLSEWSLRPMSEEAAQAATHLVSVVVNHSDAQAPGFVSVRLRIHGNNLVIEVEDEAGVLPGTIPEDPAGTRVEVFPSGRGRIARCELELPRGMRASDVPLPRRDPKRTSSSEQRSEPDSEDFDPQVMERLLSSLSKRGGQRPSHE